MKNGNSPIVVFDTETGVKGLTKREYACIKLGIPETGDPELDELIRKAERKRIATSVINGLLADSNVDATSKQIAAASLAFADELLKQFGNE